MILHIRAKLLNLFLYALVYVTFCHWTRACDACVAWMRLCDPMAEIRQTFCVPLALPLHSVLWSHWATLHFPLTPWLAYPLLFAHNLSLPRTLFPGFCLPNIFPPFRDQLTFPFLMKGKASRDSPTHLASSWCSVSLPSQSLLLFGFCLSASQSLKTRNVAILRFKWECCSLPLP